MARISRTILTAILAGGLAAPAVAQIPNPFEIIFGPPRPPQDVPSRPPSPDVPARPPRQGDLPPPPGYPQRQGNPPGQGYPPSQAYPPNQAYPPSQAYPPQDQGYPPPQAYPPGQQPPGRPPAQASRPPGGIQTQPLPPPPGSTTAPPPSQANVPAQPPSTLPPGQRQPRGTPQPANTAPQPGDEVVVAPPAQKITNPTAVFSGLDKITGRIISFDVALNETVQFGALQVTPRACYTRPPTETPNTDAFLEVEEVTLQGEVKRIFTGWMFATSPGLHAVEHPIYDVWLVDCKKDPPTVTAGTQQTPKR